MLVLTPHTIIFVLTIYLWLCRMVNFIVMGTARFLISDTDEKGGTPFIEFYKYRYDVDSCRYQILTS